KIIQERENQKTIIKNPNPTDIDITNNEIVVERITKKNNNQPECVTLAQVIEEGVWSLEVEYSGSQGQAAIGIVQESYIILSNSWPTVGANRDHIAIFTGQAWGQNSVYCKQNCIPGNIQFGESQILRTEYDSEKGSFYLFLNGVQQPVYISGIKEKVRFLVFLHTAGSYCTIRSLKKLTAPTIVKLPNEKSLQW
ncbi:MAG: hypothetical protein EZS28_051630, partial [Streblomastix strix]